MSSTTNARRTPLSPPPAGDRHRLLAGWAATRRPAGFAEHRARYGPPQSADRIGRRWLLAEVEAAGLLGRGGAGFPTARKLRAVAAARRPFVIANGCEGEPVSDKDHALLTVAPHLVFDGAELAAQLVGAREVALCVHRGDPLVETLEAAYAERPSSEVGLRVVGVPKRYVASEESALVNFVNTGDARPTTKPPRPSERGVGGRPTLVDNVETLAQLALIARYGAAWFRGCGTDTAAGTTLVTAWGAVRAPGVHEVALGTPIAGALDCAGGPSEAVQAVLVGGYGGAWLRFPAAARVPLDHDGLRAAGATLGVGSLVVLPAAACGIAETARVLRYLAGESAAQCGPCMFGLPAIAEDYAQLVLGGRTAAAARQRLRSRLPDISGRGACAHPDGAVRLAVSGLRAFDDDLRAHLSGRPCPYAAFAHLPVPGFGYEP
ncbi:NADH-ubiquinone oxidoreductase-F iron-sulfur binding region domain-containing protein [Amycolatopsis mongoliensis]|uniref:NADH-ubiquinone oxidoreductase-F iron-sulfur binding region domain-containing protein n=1 Tax=Amycolatopsis mongoliensis TaxID=715475 RepID=A0A9Y2NAD2_9PSEU|nr:NADH-ubiquinone oxidoreductase-F iron-sulfur binding region domain-containing protein [Amycolatopsis sp. 4-36]WIX98485.1 NADH-ubiquinone oxidoreductase-F iron-sulfur binding region domain-containing protein [Amycolatopsis sp. 4-36]